MRLGKLLLLLIAVCCYNVSFGQAFPPMPPRLHHHPQPHSFSHNDNSDLDYGKNIITLVPLNLINDNVQSGIGIGIGYERMLDKQGIISFYVPFYYSFNNNNDYNNNNNANPGTTHNIYVMPGLKFYPIGSNGLIRYAVGPSFVIGSGQELNTQQIYNPTAGTYQYDNTTNDYTMFGVVINNYLNICPTPHMYIGLELGIGGTFTNTLKNANNSAFNNGPIGDFNFKVGYRF